MQDAPSNHPPEHHAPAAPRPRRRWLRIAVLLVVYSALLAAGHLGGQWLTQSMGFEPGAGQSFKSNRIFWLALLAYVTLLALPFVPGVEISLALFAAFGSAVAIEIYFATVLAFIIAYLTGRLVPERVIAAAFRRFGLDRAETLVLRLAPLTPAERLTALTDHAPTRFAPVLLRYRNLALIIALNAPGNAVLGGGGGIALMAGMSGLFSFPAYLAAILIAVLPVPLATLLAGRLF